MRLGTGSSYSASNDAALQSPTISVPAGGGALSFYMWQDGFIDSDFRTWDGLIVEATAGGGYSYLEDGTYQSKQIQSICSVNSTKVPFGYAELVPMLAGDGTGTVEGGDVFDLQHQMSLDDYAGQNVRVRFRYGSHDFVDPATHGEGTWIDTVALHGPWIADAWPGTGPETLQGSDQNCDASFDLSWSAVSGAGSYDIFRSEISCADAVASLVPYASTLLTSYSDAGAVPDTQYYYAVGANDATSGCPSVRTCISGGCVVCLTPPDPADLTVGRDDDDVLMTWFGSLPVGPTWNVYRDPDKNPANWGAPLSTGVIDEDPGTPGIQFTDVGGTSVGSLQFYLVTEVTCTESPLTE
jgi:hypothetical protein